MHLGKDTKPRQSDESSAKTPWNINDHGCQLLTKGTSDQAGLRQTWGQLLKGDALPHSMGALFGGK